MILPREFYLSDDVCFLAKELLGKLLISRTSNGICSGIIVETEAYRGPDDKASHSYLNRRTPRNNSMYLEGGASYIYICYGMHHLFNIVTGTVGVGHAVLIRALEPYDGIEIMQQRRPYKTSSVHLTKGPGSLTQALGINKSLDGTILYDTLSPLQLCEINQKYRSEELGCSCRIGVESSGEAALYPWRYFVKSSPNVSAHKKALS